MAEAAQAVRPHNIVFDLGAVVFEWQPRRLLARELPHLAGTPEAAEALFQAFFSGYGGEWGEFDRGSIERTALATAIAARIGLTEAEVLRVVDGVPVELQPMAASVALMEELKAAGHRLFYLSNMPAPIAEHLVATHPLFGHFEDGVFSCDVRLIKPDPAIYEHALQRFDVAAADCVFLDDMPKNVLAARESGWRALQFSDAAQARAELRDMGLI